MQIDHRVTLEILVPCNAQNAARPHWHEEAEIIFVLSGEVSADCGDICHRIKAGNICIINAFDFHYLGISRGLALIFHLDVQQMSDHLSLDAVPFFYCGLVESAGNGRYIPFRVCLADLADILLTDSSEPYLGALYESKLYWLYYELMTNFLEYSGSGFHEKNTAFCRFREILQDVHKHFLTSVTLLELSRRHYLSQPYVSRLFKQFTQKSYTRYIVSLRLEYAKNLLLSSKLPLETVAERSGFASARSLSSYFREEYGMLPSSYRKQHRQPWLEKDIPSGLSKEYPLLATAKILLCDYTDGGKKGLLRLRYPVFHVKLPKHILGGTESIPGYHNGHLFYIPDYEYWLYQNFQELAVSFSYMRHDFAVLLGKIMGDAPGSVFLLEKNGLRQTDFGTLDMVLNFLNKHTLPPVFKIEADLVERDMLAKVLKLLFGYLRNYYFRESKNYGVYLCALPENQTQLWTAFLLARQLREAADLDIKIFLELEGAGLLEMMPELKKFPKPDVCVLSYGHFKMDAHKIAKALDILKTLEWKNLKIILSDIHFHQNSPEREKDINRNNDTFIRTAYLCGLWFKYGQHLWGLACFLLSDFRGKCGRGEAMFEGDNGIFMKINCRKSLFYLVDSWRNFCGTLSGRGENFLISEHGGKIEMMIFNPVFEKMCVAENKDPAELSYTAELLNTYPSGIYEVRMENVACEKYIAHFFVADWEHSCAFQYWLQNDTISLFNELETKSFQHMSLPNYNKKLVLSAQGRLKFSITLKACAIAYIFLEPVYE